MFTVTCWEILFFNMLHQTKSQFEMYKSIWRFYISTIKHTEAGFHTNVGIHANWKVNPMQETLQHNRNNIDMCCSHHFVK